MDRNVARACEQIRNGDTVKSVLGTVRETQRWLLNEHLRHVVHAHLITRFNLEPVMALPCGHLHDMDDIADPALIRAQLAVTLLGWIEPDVKSLTVEDNFHPDPSWRAPRIPLFCLQEVVVEVEAIFLEKKEGVDAGAGHSPTPADTISLLSDERHPSYNRLAHVARCLDLIQSSPEVFLDFVRDFCVVFLRLVPATGDQPSLSCAAWPASLRATS